MIKIYKVMYSKMILLFLFGLTSILLSAQYNPNGGGTVYYDIQDYLKNNLCVTVDFAYESVYGADQLADYMRGHSAFENSLITQPFGPEHLIYRVPVGGNYNLNFSKCYGVSGYNPISAYESTPFDIFTWNPYTNGGTGAYDPLNASDPRNNPGYGYTEENQYQGGAGASPPTPPKPEEPCKSKIACAGVIVNCKCAFKWYIDADKDGHSSTIKITDAVFPSPGPEYIIGSPFGPDCDDKNPKVQKLNKCGKCEDEPKNGNCPCYTSKDDLKLLFEKTGIDKNLAVLANMINKYASALGIDSKIKLQHLLSQTGIETGGFKTLQVSENLNYITASLIPDSYDKFTLDTKKEPTKLDAKLYVNNPEKLANAAMCCITGNGPEASGDGWKYRGRGIMQLTWKSNYEKFQTWYNDNYNPDIDVVKNPDLISTDDNLAVLSGMWYFKVRVLDKIKPFDSKATVKKVTKKINPGFKALEDRQMMFTSAGKLIKCNN